MLVRVDPRKCKTVGICVRKCPEVFRFETGSKKAVAIEGEIPPNLEGKCRSVAELCPEDAIIIIE